MESINNLSASLTHAPCSGTIIGDIEVLNGEKFHAKTMIASTRVTTYEIPIYDFRQIFAAKTVNNKKHEEIMVLREENDARHKVGQLTSHVHTTIQSPPFMYVMDC